VLDVKVRFQEKNATVRYLPDQVALSRILKQYDSTPFTISLAGPVVTIAQLEKVVLRGWTQRTVAATKNAAPKNQAKDDAPQPIKLFVEMVVQESADITANSRFSFADPVADSLTVTGDLKETEITKKPIAKKAIVKRFVTRLYESVALKSGDSIVPVKFAVTTIDPNKKQTEATGTLQVVLRTPPRKTITVAPGSRTVALIDGKLDLKLGHLCTQRGCVEHFHSSLSTFGSMAAVDPHASLQHPGATIYLRAGHAIDIWSLRETLRDQSIEIAGIVPRDLNGYRLHVELPRWKVADQASAANQCLSCRNAALKALQTSPLVKETRVAGGGISSTPKQGNIDLVEILDALAQAGVAPQAVWLAPANVAIPKASSPLNVKPNVEPRSGGSPTHPQVQFTFAHKCDTGSTVLAMIGQPSWVSQTEFEFQRVSTARTLIADRKNAALSPLLSEFRTAGQLPAEIRLSNFGDVRIYLEFAHICGDIVYSKPPKPKKKTAQQTAGNKENNKAETPEEAKPIEPFVPKALRPATSSNGRKAIQAAIESVPWIKNAIFFDYHTKFQFRGGPQKVMIAFQPKDTDGVRLDYMIDALRSAGFPPRSVMVSRCFSGISFTQPLPGKLLLNDRDGKEKQLSSLKQPKRPLALAFVSLKCKRHKKYEADPKYYKHLSQTIEKYKDRVDFVTIAANPDDKFEDVVAFLEKTKLPVPLHDAKGIIRSALNAQETPAPHFYIFDSDGLFRYAGDPHGNWEKPDEKKDDYLAQALDVVLSGKFAKNGAAFLNKSLCNCSHPKCKCPKCGCGPSCRCAIKH
jgi:hypothetical protein